MLITDIYIAPSADIAFRVAGWTWLRANCEPSEPGVVRDACGGDIQRSSYHLPQIFLNLVQEYLLYLLLPTTKFRKDHSYLSM
jgi:hypothetical protein